MARILVTGSNGQLGSELRNRSSSISGYEFLFTDREQLAINEPASIENFFSKNKITHCINSAAYTAVDLAETNREEAIRINSEAVGNLARACWQQEAQFIHISTDYVFDGKGKLPYKESDAVNPVNFYGSSKLAGEYAAIDNNPLSIIIRTSWLYSSYGKNFVKTMVRLMNEKTNISVVNDQFGSPTYAGDLADVILKIISNQNAARYAGIYHYANTGIISWYDFAVAIRDLIGSNCKVDPVPSSGYPTPASRPAFSGMNTNKIQENFDIQIPGWKDGLGRCLRLLV